MGNSPGTSWDKRPEESGRGAVLRELPMLGKTIPTT